MKSTMQKQRITARITGVVQGVSYRASAQRVARSLRLVGWVRNTDDGGVELEAEGSRESLEALLEWCASGPPGAAVDELDSHDIAVVGQENDFTVRR